MLSKKYHKDVWIPGLSLFVILLLIFPAFLSAQDANKPRNLKQAVKLLNSLMPDSIKTLVKNTNNNDYYLKRTPNSKFNLIEQWLDDDIEDPKLLIYLRKKGLEYNLASVVLAAFKNSLSDHPKSESAVIKPFLEKLIRNNKEDQIRYTLDTLDGHYIPKDLDEAIAAMDSFFSDSLRIKVKALTSDEFTGRFHLGFGTSLRNRWHLWGGSRLTRWFEERGVNHAESISGIIMESYHRKLNDRAIDLDGQVREDQEFWSASKEKSAKREQEQRETEKESFEEEYHIGDTVTYRYHSGYASVKQREDDYKELCIAKGIILAKEPKDLYLNIRVLETCDKKGIVRYDNVNSMYYDEKLKRYIKPRKRVKTYVKAGKAFWSKFDSWAPSEYGHMTIDNLIAKDKRQVELSDSLVLKGQQATPLFDYQQCAIEQVKKRKINIISFEYDSLGKETYKKQRIETDSTLLKSSRSLDVGNVMAFPYFSNLDTVVQNQDIIHIKSVMGNIRHYLKDLKISLDPATKQVRKITGKFIMHEYSLDSHTNSERLYSAEFAKTGNCVLPAVVIYTTLNDPEFKKPALKMEITYDLKE